jgi:hypothetical protein
MDRREDLERWIAATRRTQQRRSRSPRTSRGLGVVAERTSEVAGRDLVGRRDAAESGTL